MIDPNKNMAGFKKTRIGWIPKGWKCVQLGEVFEERTVKGKDGLPTYSVTMEHGLIPRATLDRKMAPDVEVGTSLLVEKGDIAYNMMRMWQGAVAVADTRCVVSPAYVVCHPTAFVHPQFMLRYFKSHIGLYQLWAYSHGITGDRLRLYFGDFEKVPAPLPPYAEQAKIDAIISASDDATKRTRDLITAKREQKKALMQQLLTGEKRLPGFKEKWTTHRLGELFLERTECNSDHLPLLAITGSRGVIPASEIDRKDASSEDKSRYKVIRPGDIGYNTMRMWQGVSAVSRLEGLVSPAYTICIPHSCVDVNFMGYFFKFPPMIHVFWRHSQGLVDDTLSLKYQNFARILVSIPGLREQKAIADVLRASDDEVSVLEQKVVALQQQKTGLIQKLLTGQIRVKV